MVIAAPVEGPCFLSEKTGVYRHLAVTPSAVRLVFPTPFLFGGVISYCAAFTTRQKSGTPRLPTVWNYANVAAIGQHVCPIS